jgi:hypothetical protein
LPFPPFTPPHWDRKKGRLKIPKKFNLTVHGKKRGRGEEKRLFLQTKIGGIEKRKKRKTKIF